MMFNSINNDISNYNSIPLKSIYIKINNRATVHETINKQYSNEISTFILISIKPQL